MFQTPHRGAATARPGAWGVKPQTSLGERREATGGVLGSCDQTCHVPEHRTAPCSLPPHVVTRLQESRAPQSRAPRP